MKKFAHVLLLFVAIIATTSFVSKNDFGAFFAWEKTTHDFGKIVQNKPVTYVFEFTNTGDSPLVITNAQGSCGCTVPSYPKEPIGPGEKGEIKVSFNAASMGVFNKTVTITANTDKPATLTIKGEVTAAKQ